MTKKTDEEIIRYYKEKQFCKCFELMFPELNNRLNKIEQGGFVIWIIGSVLALALIWINYGGRIAYLFFLGAVITLFIVALIEYFWVVKKVKEQLKKEER